MKKCLLFSLILIFTFQSCTINLNRKNSDEIIITKEYLYRNTIEQKNKLGFYIEKIRPLENSFPPNMYEKIEDTKFTCHIKKLEGDTIYFNKKQKGVLWYSFKDNQHKDYFGDFEKESWYHFIQLYKTYDYFIYINNVGDLTQYRYNKSNW